MSKFWLEDFSQLARPLSIIPNASDTLAEKMNALSRLSILISAGIALLNPMTAIVVLLSTLIPVAAIYFGVSAKMYEEGFAPYYDAADGLLATDTVPGEDCSCGAADPFRGNTRIVGDPPYIPSLAFPNVAASRRFCDDMVPLTFNCDTVSPNQLLLGGANPKTLVDPIVAPPTHNLDYWHATPLTTHSAINARSNFDVARSGYEGVAYRADGPLRYVGYGVTSEEEEEEEKVDAPRHRYKSRADLVATQTLQPGVYQRSRFDEPINANIGISMQKQFDPMIITSSGAPVGNRVEYEAVSLRRDDDDSDTSLYADGRERHWLRHKRPQSRSASPLGRADDDAHGVYDIDDLLRNRCARRGGAAKTIRALVGDRVVAQTESNVYDPRFTGYGAPNRAYLEPVTGQPRFFYDDVNAVTMPNYVARSNVDVFPWAAQYGPDVGVPGYGDGYKQLANDAFLQSSLKFRTELQARLLRKRNAEMWQRRVAPISSASNSGGTASSCA
jgi:hypothetical protein